MKKLIILIMLCVAFESNNAQVNFSGSVGVTFGNGYHNQPYQNYYGCNQNNNYQNCYGCSLYNTCQYYNQVQPTIWQMQNVYPGCQTWVRPVTQCRNVTQRVWDPYWQCYRLQIQRVCQTWYEIYYYY